jgi:hypothetical protein
MRIENGVRTTDNPQANLPRSCASGMQMFTYIPTVREPKSMRLAEVFKIVDGRLHTIEAFIRYEPLGAQTGWPG